MVEVTADFILNAQRKSETVRRPLARGRGIESSGSHGKYLQTVLTGEAERVRSASEGTRNATLNRSAFSCAQFAELSDSTIEDELTAAAEACGLRGHEIAATIASGIKAGRAEPREVPESSRQANDGWTPSDEGAPDAVPAGGTQPNPLKPVLFADVLAQWAIEGYVQRVPVGIPTLDRACAGGLPLPRRILIVGAPSAGKTYLETWLAHRLAYDEIGFVVGIMAVDEDPCDIVTRFAQMRGFTSGEIESRNPAVLAGIGESLKDAKIRFYDSAWSIEAATLDLANWGRESGLRCILCVDSVHTVWSERGAGAKTAKERVDANCKALKVAHQSHRITVIATSEMSRTQYANEKFANDANAIAAGADSRELEYWAQTQLKLTTPRDCPDTIKVYVAKNRDAKCQKDVTFWLALDRESHDLHEVGDPDANPETVANREADRVSEQVQKNSRDAATLACFIEAHQGLNSRKLRTAVSADPHLGWGNGRTDKALAVLEGNRIRGLSYRTETDGQQVLHYIDRT